MIYNIFFILVTVYCCVFYVLLLFVQCWPRLCVSTFCIDWLIDKSWKKLADIKLLHKDLGY